MIGPQSTFMHSAYENFTRLMDVCLQYHMDRHKEITGDSLVNCARDTVVEGDVVYHRWFVEGTLVLVHEYNRKTANQVIRTTNGDRWYSDDNAPGLFPAQEIGESGDKDTFVA